MNDFLNAILYESWPWYVGGPLIGIIALGVLLAERKVLGVSSSFEQVCAIALPKSETRNSILRDTWQIWFVCGMMIGGAVLYYGGMTSARVAISDHTLTHLANLGVSETNGYVPAQLYTFALPQVIVLIVGGLIIGFGARYAGGCTAGHSIAGIASLSPGSMIATAGFFGGGLLSTWFLVPLIFAL